MNKYCRDVDLARYEPGLFGDLHFSWQVLCQGTQAAIVQRQLTAAGGNFAAAGVEAGCVMWLDSGDGTLVGPYEVAAVDAADRVTLAILRADGSTAVAGPPDCGSVAYRVCSYDPQATEVLFSLTQYFGIRPGHPMSPFSVENVPDAEVFRQAMAFGVLAAVYATLASGDERDRFWKKSEHYRMLHEKARERCRVSLDVSGDGTADRMNLGGSVRLTRR